ncbi:MAG: hypothetical protein R3A10_10940 [Caldilineaceae bacterium]
MSAWTAGRSPREQRALVRAYRRVLQELPGLWPHRPQGDETMEQPASTTGTSAVASAASAADAQMAAVVINWPRWIAELEDAQMATVRQATAALAQRAQAHQAASLETLQRGSYVVEQPLTSQTPVIGPLLAWFRNIEQHRHHVVRAPAVAAAERLQCACLRNSKSWSPFSGRRTPCCGRPMRCSRSSTSA